MAQQLINHGTTPGDGTGESPFSGMQKANANFTELYAAKTSLENAIATKAPINNPTFTGTVNGVTKAMVGLGNVDNVADANKPVSTAQATAIAAGDVERLMVSDMFNDFIVTGLSTPVPSNSLTGILAAGIAYAGGKRTVRAVSDSFTYLATRDTYVDLAPDGTITRTAVVNGGAEPSLAAGSIRLEKVVTDSIAITTVTPLARTYSLSNVDNTSDANKPISTATQAALNLKAPINNPTFTGTVGGVTKAMVGLGNVDNTSDVNKPVSTAAQAALDLKAPISNPTFTGTVGGITKTMVGLGNVDNTADAAKPVSAAQLVAINNAAVNSPGVNDVFIDPSAGTNGDGSKASPFNTWAGIAWAAGKRYLQKAGTTFTGMVTIGASGTASAPITIGSYGVGAKPIFNADNANSYAIYGTARNYIVIDGVEAKGSTNTTWGAIHLDSSTGSVIKNCSVTSSAAAGISLYNPTNCSVTDNKVTGVTKAGICVIANGASYLGNTVARNDTVGSVSAASSAAINIETWATGIYIGVLVEDNYCHDSYYGTRFIGPDKTSIIRRNKCLNNLVAGIAFLAFDTNTQIHDVLIQDNICNTNGQYGIHTNRTGKCIIERNTCNYNGSNASPYFGRGIEISGGTNVLNVVGPVVRNNTCCYNYNYTANFSEGVGIGLDDASRNISCYGNICHSNQGNGIQLHGGASMLGGGHSVYGNVLIDNATLNSGTFKSNLHVNLTNGALISDNVLVGAAQGYYQTANNSADILFSNNTIQRATEHGIYLEGTAGLTEQNTVFLQNAVNVYGGTAEYQLGTNKVFPVTDAAYLQAGVAIAMAEMMEKHRLRTIEAELAAMKKAAPTGTVWYVRPDTSHNATRNGNSYDTAWGGWSEIVWGAGGVQAGHTLYVCGNHAYSAASITVGNHGATSGNPVTIRGDYAVSPGVITFTGAYFLNMNSRDYTVVAKLKIVAGTSTCIYGYGANGCVIEMCDLSGGVSAVTPSTFAINDFTLRYNHCYGGTQHAFPLLINTASTTCQGVKVYGNYFHDYSQSAVRLSVEGAAIGTSKFSNCDIYDNVFVRNVELAIQVRNGPADTTTPCTLFNDDIQIWNNVITLGGYAAGDNGKAGGIGFQGNDATCAIRNNTVSFTYVQGAGIQTAKNTGAFEISGNCIHDIYSGTPTAQFNGGLPIDANGIFLDNLSNGGKVFRNMVWNLAGTGHANSGVAFAHWDCDNGEFYENIAKNVRAGLSYGASTESGNSHKRNLIIDAAYGMWKVNNYNITHTMLDNTFCNCTTIVGGGTGGTLIK